MNATARIIVSELNNVLTLENRFIRIDRTTQQAFVTVAREDGTFEEIPVTLGLRNDTTSQILSGLDDEQRVVLVPRNAFNPVIGR
jgi:multidrug efflux pump subunit AcrA (membrane-fusion protein)